MNKKKLVALLLTVVLVLPFMLSGCSLLEKITIDKATEYIEEAFDAIKSDPSCINDFSKKEVDIPSLDEYQQLVFDEAMDSFNFELTSVDYEYGDETLSVVIELSFIEFADISSELSCGTQEAFSEAISDARTKDKKVKLTLNKKNSELIFKDLSDIAELAFEGYEGICILDENGNPYIVNGAFLELHCLGCYWYDPMTGNPISGSNLSSPVALQPVFYFDMPFSYTFTIGLYKDGDLIASMEIIMVDALTCMADFSVAAGDVTSLSSGSYSASILVDEEPVYSSDDINVN